MIKIENYIIESYLADLYEGDLYEPEGFAEYIKYSKDVEEIYATVDRCLLSLHEMLCYEEAYHPDTYPGEEDFDPEGKVKKWEREPISREKYLYGTRMIKFASQLPKSAQSQAMDRTLLSTDNSVSRYIGNGINGALSHRAKTGQMSDHAIEMRFVKPGKPNPYIIDPVTFTTIPNLGAILAPSRVAALNLQPGKRKTFSSVSAVPNPHQGYLYDGLTDPDENGIQKPLAQMTEKGKFGDTYSPGVFVPYRSIAREVETANGAPMRYYHKKIDNVWYPSFDNPSARQGKVGTSMAPPHGNDADSYLGDMPGALGFRVTATAAGGRYQRGKNPIRKDASSNPDDRFDLSTGNTGGAGTVGKSYRRWVQGIGEHPNWFNQRLPNFMLRQKRQYMKGVPLIGPDGKPFARTPNKLSMEPETGEPRPWMTHAAPLSGKRSRNQRHPFDPVRRRVEPASKVVASPERVSALDKYFSNPMRELDFLQKKIDYYNSLDTDGAKEMAAYYQDYYDRRVADPEPETSPARTLKSKIDQRLSEPGPRYHKVKAGYEKGRLRRSS